MNNKKKISKMIMPLLLILISFGVVYSIYTDRRQRALPQEIANPNQLYNQTAMPTIFAPTPHPSVVTLNWAYANPNLLRINLTISGLELVANADDLENLICTPYIDPDEPVSLTLNYREAQIPNQRGDPIEITYEYGMDAGGYESLAFSLDLTIGPCGPHFDESNVTPYPTDLIANYHLTFSVPVE
jgi:hypothetical protein